MRAAALCCCVHRELRAVSGSALNISGWPDVPACVKKGEEVRAAAIAAVTAAATAAASAAAAPSQHCFDTAAAPHESTGQAHSHAIKSLSFSSRCLHRRCWRSRAPATLCCWPHTWSCWPCGATWPAGSSSTSTRCPLVPLHPRTHPTWARHTATWGRHQALGAPTVGPHTGTGGHPRGPLGATGVTGARATHAGTRQSPVATAIQACSSSRAHLRGPSWPARHHHPGWCMRRGPLQMAGSRPARPSSSSRCTTCRARHRSSSQGRPQHR
jgi:hypothetical protein